MRGRSAKGGCWWEVKEVGCALELEEGVLHI